MFYECESCGQTEKQEIRYDEESTPNIKIHIILKPSTEKPRHTKLVHENFFITFSNAGSISPNLQSRLNNAVTLYKAKNGGIYQIESYWV